MRGGFGRAGSDLGQSRSLLIEEIDGFWSLDGDDMQIFIELDFEIFVTGIVLQ